MGHDVTGTERGASLVEYALVLALVVLVCLAGLRAFGDAAGASLGDSSSSVAEAGP